MGYEELASKLKFDEKGLIPTIAQDHFTGEVLMMAYMNAESLKRTIEEGYMVYWSRSREKLWKKGETSGCVQKLIELHFDCDADCLLAKVEQTGAACHTGNRTCFFTPVIEKSEKPATSAVIDELYRVIQSRKDNPVEGSYTCKLFNGGMERIAKKVGEEAAEVIIAGMKGIKSEIRYESADLIFHLLVLLADSGMTPAEIYGELASRRK